MYPVNAASSLVHQLKTFCQETLDSITQPVCFLGSKALDLSKKTAQLGKDAMTSVHNYFLPEAPPLSMTLWDWLINTQELELSTSMAYTTQKIIVRKLQNVFPKYLMIL